MKNSQLFSYTVEQPSWLEQLTYPDKITETEEQMDFVIQMAKINVENKTGGPFAAAVFNDDTGELISAAVNVVMASHCSIAHAEINAISLAQQRLETPLMQSEENYYRLVSSAEPCVQCCAALHWTKIKTLVYGASAEQVEEIGFDEGEKPEYWEAQLQQAGVTIKKDVLNQKSLEILRLYKNTGGYLYNG